MAKLVIPVVLALIGLGGGAGAAFMTRPEPSVPDDLVEAKNPCGDPVALDDQEVQPIESESATEYAVLGKQFLVPVIEDDVLSAMILVSLSIEVPEGQTQQVYDKEPRLRDRVLQDMFAHSNIGGFSGNYTSVEKMKMLRQDLLRTTRDVIGDTALDVLVLDLVRQEM